MTSKITKQACRGCLSTAVFPKDCHNIILYYYSKHEVWFLWGEKVLIREI